MEASYLLEHETAVRAPLSGAIPVKPWIEAHELRRALDAYCGAAWSSGTRLGTHA